MQLAVDKTPFLIKYCKNISNQNIFVSKWQTYMYRLQLDL